MQDEQKDTIQDTKKRARKSPEELRKQFIQSAFFTVSAFIALVVIGMAWFVNNSSVSATGMQVKSVGAKYELATKREDTSVRDIFGLDKLFNLSGNSSTEEGAYDASKDGDALSLYLTESTKTGLNNYKQTSRLFPGDSGKITFYIHPLADDMTSINLNLMLGAYTGSNLDNVGADDASVSPLDDSGIADDLLKGHILFFKNYDASKESSYSGWIDDYSDLTLYPMANGKASYTQPTDTSVSFTNGAYYEVTLYWIWPKYFRNYAYIDPNQGDLFSSTEDIDYKNLIADMNTDASAKKYFYSLPEVNSNPAAMTTVPVDEITSAMNNADFNICTQYYNEADEYLGENVKYVLFKVTTEE